MASRAAYLSALRPGHADRLSGPLVAMGAAIACEVAARLDDVRLVAMAGTGVPELPGTGTGSWLGEPPWQPGAWPARGASCSAGQ